MRKSICIAIFYLLVIGLIMGGNVASSDQGNTIGPLGLNEIHIAPNGISMPLERIILIRKDTAYCAVKFTKFWTGKTEKDLYSSYESYFQGDGTGDFSNNNIKVIREELYSPKAKWSLFGHPVSFGAKKEVKCGPIMLWWTGKGSIYFYERYQSEGDYGIELAPTIWTDISEVNVLDRRIIWYIYDNDRPRVSIPVNQIWEE